MGVNIDDYCATLLGWHMSVTQNGSGNVQANCCGKASLQYGHSFVQKMMYDRQLWRSDLEIKNSNWFGSQRHIEITLFENGAYMTTFTSTACGLTQGVQYSFSNIHDACDTYADLSNWKLCRILSKRLKDWKI